MNRGMVFWSKGKLVLLEENLETGYISDYEDFYRDLGSNKAEIVTVDHHELIGLVSIKGVYSMSFYNLDEPCTAEEAIGYALEHDPDVLVERMLDNEE